MRVKALATVGYWSSFIKIMGKKYQYGSYGKKPFWCFSFSWILDLDRSVTHEHWTQIVSLIWRFWWCCTCEFMKVFYHILHANIGTNKMGFKPVEWKEKKKKAEQTMKKTKLSERLEKILANVLKIFWNWYERTKSNECFENFFEF